MINKKKDNKNGILLFDKKENITSAQALNNIKKKLNIKKAGHCGTLDPFASGLLIVCLGKTTKIARYITDLPKEYIAKVKFGEERDTYDITGVCTRKSNKKIKINELEDILTIFSGEIYQTPPLFSAIKINGTRSYDYARKGIDIKLAPRKITIHKCSMESFENNEAILKIKCSKGTYVRSLAFDIGRKTGALAYLASLKRTKIGHFSLNSKATINEKHTKEECEKNIISIEQALSFLPSMKIKEEEEKRIRFGQSLTKEMFKTKNMQSFKKNTIYSIKDKQDKLIAIVNDELKYLNVFIS